MNESKKRMKGRVLHNALFAPEDGLGRMNYQDFRDNMMFDNFPPQPEIDQVPEAPIIAIDATDGYDITLVPNELTANIIDEGHGPTPAPGQYVTLMERIFYQGQHYDLRRGKATYLFGRNKNPIGLQLFFAISKQNMKARIQFGPKFTKKFNFPTSKMTQNVMIRAEIKIISIQNQPQANNIADLLIFNEEIIELSQQADNFFYKGQYQEGLKAYELVTEKINSKYYIQCISRLNRKFIKKKTLKAVQNDKKQEKEKQNDFLAFIPERDNFLAIRRNQQQDQDQKDEYNGLNELQKKEKLQNESKIVENIQKFSEKVAIKAIQASFLCGQYFKTIRWANKFLTNPRYAQNQRVLLTRSRCYLIMEQFQRAMEGLKIIKLFNPNNQYIEKEMQLIQSKKIDYDIKQKKQVASRPIKALKDFIKIRQQEQLFQQLQMGPKKKKKKKKNSHRYLQI